MPSQTLALIESSVFYVRGLDHDEYSLNVPLVKALKDQGIDDIHVVVDVLDSGEMEYLQKVIESLKGHGMNVTVIGPCDNAISKECAKKILGNDCVGISQKFLLEVFSPQKPDWAQNMVVVTRNNTLVARMYDDSGSIISPIHYSSCMSTEQFKDALDEHQSTVLEQYYADELRRLEFASKGALKAPLLIARIDAEKKKLTRDTASYKESMVDLINVLASTNKFITGKGYCLTLDKKGLVTRLEPGKISFEEYQKFANQLRGHPRNGLRAIGLCMLILSISLIPGAGTAMGIGLVVTAVAGIGLFGVNCRRGLSKVVYEAGNEAEIEQARLREGQMDPATQW